MALWLQDMYIWLGFHLEAAKLLVRKQGLDSPERKRVLMDKSINICNVMKKLGSKSANGMVDRGKKVSVIAQENLKLAAFLFYQRWRCTLDGEVTGMYKDTVHLLTTRGLKTIIKTQTCCQR